MGMKRFLILFSLIAFVLVSCAGPNKVGLTRRGSDFRQNEFEKDCKECMETAKKEESYSQTSGVFDYCMFTKGYEFKSIGENRAEAVFEIFGAILLGIAGGTLGGLGHGAIKFK